MTLLEPDVALTDFGLTIECLALAAWLRLQSLIAAGHRGTIPTQGQAVSAPQVASLTAAM